MTHSSQQAQCPYGADGSAYQGSIWCRPVQDQVHEPQAGRLPLRQTSRQPATRLADVWGKLQSRIATQKQVRLDKIT